MHKNKTIQFYDKNAKDYFKRNSDIDLNFSREKFLKYLLPVGKILDAGCGFGRDGKKFLEMGFKLTAFDASIEMVKLATEYMNHPVLHLSFEEMDFNAEFDGIWCSAALLHVPSNELLAILKKFTKALKPNGILFISFKYGSFEGEMQGRFFLNLTTQSLKNYINQIPELSILESWLEFSKKTTQRWIQCLCRKDQCK